MKARQKAYLTQREKELALGNSKGLSHKSENSTLEKKNKLQPVGLFVCTYLYDVVFVVFR